MTLSEQEFDAIIADETKRIENDIVWAPVQNQSALDFRAEIDSDAGYPLFLVGRYNHYSGKLSYTIIHRIVGRILGLDLGQGHINPDSNAVGETHKNYWKPGYRDKWAYEPQDITHPWNRPVDVWAQFCVEANLEHKGIMRTPRVQGVLRI